MRLVFTPLDAIEPLALGRAVNAVEQKKRRWIEVAGVASLLVANVGQAHENLPTRLGKFGSVNRLKAPVGVLECVPFARAVSGVQLYGDAYTWWAQAAGKYARGKVPQQGAVMALRPYGRSVLGHVATVSQIINSRTILISHANWSSPGKIERDVKAVDVSPANDWSEVRVWYDATRTLGAAHWPVSGFIYRAQVKGEPKLRGAQKLHFAYEKLLGTKRRDSPRYQRVGRGNQHDDPIGAIIAGKYRAETSAR